MISIDMIFINFSEFFKKRAFEKVKWYTFSIPSKLQMTSIDAFQNLGCRGGPQAPQAWPRQNKEQNILQKSVFRSPGNLEPQVKCQPPVTDERACRAINSRTLIWKKEYFPQRSPKWSIFGKNDVVDFSNIRKRSHDVRMLKIYCLIDFKLI